MVAGMILPQNKKSATKAPCQKITHTAKGNTVNVLPGGLFEEDNTLFSKGKQ